MLKESLTICLICASLGLYSQTGTFRPPSYSELNSAIRNLHEQHLQFAVTNFYSSYYNNKKSRGRAEFDGKSLVIKEMMVDSAEIDYKIGIKFLENSNYEQADQYFTKAYYRLKAFEEKDLLNMILVGLSASRYYLNDKDESLLLLKKANPVKGNLMMYLAMAELYYLHDQGILAKYYLQRLLRKDKCNSQANNLLLQINKGNEKAVDRINKRIQKCGQS